MSKSVLRKKYIDIRNSIENTADSSDDILNFIVGSDLYNNADTVLAYWSVGSEVMTHKIIDRALRDKKKVALPKCTDKNGNMRFYYVASLYDLADGMYGIKEPLTDAIADVFNENSVCLVPGLSFDKKGYRLGYGKGYYDRFLSDFAGISIGLCYDSCLSDELPKDEFDIKVNYIITNTKIYDLNKEE